LGRDLGWHHAGGWRVRFDSDLSFLAMSRPLLEFRVAERVRALPNAAVRDGVRVTARSISTGTSSRMLRTGCTTRSRLTTRT
jgi:hypothetical protein